MTKDEKALPQSLRQMVEDIKDPKCSYWLKANYFDVQRGGPPSPTERRRAALVAGTTLCTGVPALWNPQFEEDTMQIDVILKNMLPAEHERIRPGRRCD